MRMPPLPADSIHARACKLKCEKILTRPLFASIQIFLQKHNAYFLQTSNKLHRSVQLYVSLITICLVPTEQKRLLK